MGWARGHGDRRVIAWRIVAAMAVGVAVLASAVPAGAKEISPEAHTARRAIVFPVVGATSYRAGFGDCRDQCRRRHEGTDVIAPRLAPLVAARDATVVALVTDPRVGGIYGNNVVLEDAEGWTYHYSHLNNDTPGTDDGRNPPAWIVPPGIAVGARVAAGQLIGWNGDSGNAEGTTPHLHFEIHQPGALVIDPYGSLRQAPVLGAPVDPDATAGARAHLEAIARHVGRGPLGDVERAFALDRLRAGQAVSVADGLARTRAWHDRLVADLYRRYLRRDPDPAGAVHWRQALDAGAPPEQLAVALLTSIEVASGDHAAWVDRLYGAVLGRPVDEAGRAHWLARLSDGATRAHVAAAVSGSREHAGSRVAAVFGLVLAREPDAGGAAHWAPVVERHGERHLAAVLFLSEEFRTSG